MTGYNEAYVSAGTEPPMPCTRLRVVDVTRDLAKPRYGNDLCLGECEAGTE